MTSYLVSQLNWLKPFYEIKNNWLITYVKYEQIKTKIWGIISLRVETKAEDSEFREKKVKTLNCLINNRRSNWCRMRNSRVSEDHRGDSRFLQTEAGEQARTCELTGCRSDDLEECELHACVEGAGLRCRGAGLLWWRQVKMQRFIHTSKTDGGSSWGFAEGGV